MALRDILRHITRRLGVTLTLGLIVVGAAQGATKTDITALDDLLSQQSPRELVERARRHMAQGEDIAVDSATVYLSIATSRMRSQHSTDEQRQLYIEALTMLGRNYLMHYFDYTQAYTNLRQAQDLAEEHAMTAQLPSIYLNLGVLFVQNYVLTKDPKALAEGSAYLGQAFAMARENGLYQQAIRAFTNLITLSIYYGQSTELKEYTDDFREMELPAEMSKEYLTATILLTAAQDYADGHPDKALAYFNSLSQQFSDRPDAERFRFEIMLNNNRAHALDLMGRRADALPLLLENERLANEEGFRDVLFHTYRNLADLYTEMGNNQKANDYLIKYYEAKDSLSDDNALGNIYEMKFRYSLDKTTREAEALAQREREQRIMLWFILAIAIVVAITIVLKWRDYQRLKGNYTALYQKNVELMGLKQNAPKYRTSTLSTEDKERIAADIRKVLTTNDEVYSSDFSLGRLAELVDAPSKAVSQVINEMYGKNFNNLLTEQRVRQACVRLQDPEQRRRYTIASLAESVGFKSRTNFTTNFKSVTGLTPSQFIHESQG
ncbi:MAG: AraC family transcriptional regulator [Bacteroidales bacterium]|nr:AraC family transcriptional regulator [Bacteroidales bacterium]